MVTITDQAQRQQAIDPDSSFIIQAPAGSGKTGLLIQRYLKLLTRVEHPEEIIAMTFTRKAAAEMQGRVLSALALASQDEEAGSVYEKETQELARAALQHDRQSGWKLLENPGRLRIQTIDAYCASLVRQMPLLSQIGGMQEVMDDATAAFEQAVDTTLLTLESSETQASAVIKLLEHLDNDLPRLKSLLVNMLHKRDQWLPHILDGYERKDLLNSLVNLIQEKLSEVRKLIPGDLSGELCELLKFATENLRALKPDSTIMFCADIEDLPGAIPEDLDKWRGIAEFLLTSGDTWRIQLNKNIGFPPASSKSAASIQFSEMKDRMKSLLDRISRIDGLEQALADIKILPPADIGEYEWEIISALCRLLKLTAMHLQILFNQRGRQDFIGIATSAVSALGSEDEPTDLAIYLDYQIKHILVDEFQDISLNQHKLLKLLTTAWSGIDGRTLFLVGDPMQSIYRFREAEVGNFIRTFHHCSLGSVKLTPLVLTSNFRSQSGIVNWVNETFAGILAKQDDLTTGAVSFHPSTATDDNGQAGAINIHPLFDNNEQVEAQSILRLVQSLQVSDPDSEIAILVRTRHHLLEIVPQLRKANIPCQAIDIESLSEKQAILDIISLLRAWLYPTDRIAWFSILRAPWCGIDLQHLLLIAGHGGEDLITDRLNDESLLSQCNEESRRRIHTVARLFKDAQRFKHRLPVSKCIEMLWMRLGGPASLKNESELDDARVLFELLNSLERGGDIDDLDLLLHEISRLFGKPDPYSGNKAVQVMTMHKAKGLEFDHVILPGLGRSPRYSSTELMKWMTSPREDGRDDLYIGAIRQTGEDHVPLYKYIQNMEKKKDDYEAQRLMYVAVTRAKKTLHLYGNAQIKQDRKGDENCSVKKGSLLNLLWEEVQNEFSTAMKGYQHPAQDNEHGINQINMRLSGGWKLPDIPESSKHIKEIDVVTMEHDQDPIEFIWAGETIKRTGIVVHRYIQRIAKEGITSWSSERIDSIRSNIASSLIRAGLSREEIDEGVEQVNAALSNLIQDERGRWILAEQHTEQDNELSLTGIYDDQLITAVIDRTFVDDNGIRWIVDYKSSRHEGTDLETFLDQEQERYFAQLKRYGVLMQALDDRPVRLGLYYPLLRGWREWALD